MVKPTDDVPNEDNQSEPTHSPDDSAAVPDEASLSSDSEKNHPEETVSDQPTSEPVTIDATTVAEEQVLAPMEEDELLQQMAGIFLLWWNWAYFEIKVVKPQLSTLTPPRMIMPEIIAGTNEAEFVYPICDFGHTLSTSKATDMFSVGMSMCKMYYTIEKIIAILIDRLKEGENGIDGKTEVQVMFEGHLLAQRKAFESIINLNYNVVVANFDPSTWGERYLEMVKRMADKGYGYPSEAPRNVYKLSKASKTSGAAKART